MSNSIDKPARLANTREMIEQYLIAEEGTVTLTPKQHEILLRWEYADEMIRKDECKRETIAQLIMRKFGVKRATAYQDIASAESVFASSTPMNKKYRIGLRIEHLERWIAELKGTDDLNKHYLAADLEKTLEKYWKQYPDATVVRSPKTFVFNINGGVLPAPGMNVAEALEKAKNIIHLPVKK